MRFAGELPCPLQLLFRRVCGHHVDMIQHENTKARDKDYTSRLMWQQCVAMLLVVVGGRVWFLMSGHM